MASGNGMALHGPNSQRKILKTWWHQVQHSMRTSKHQASGSGMVLHGADSHRTTLKTWWHQVQHSMWTSEH